MTSSSAARRGRGRGLFLIVSLFVLTGCSLPSRPVESAQLLFDIVAMGEPSALQRQRPPVTRNLVSYEVDGRRHAGDLYRSGDDGRAALVLVPGVAEAGRDDPRLVALASSLARARFVVLVPELTDLQDLQVGPQDVRDIADAAVWLASQPELGRSGGVGIAAASYAVGPAVLAALEPGAMASVRFLLGIGGYYDLTHAVTFLVTGCYQDLDAVWTCRDPNPFAKWVFLSANLWRIEDPDDRNRLEQIAELQLLNPDRSVPAERMDGLGPEAASVLRLLLNEDPERMPALLAALPEPMRRDWQQLSPSRADLSRLQARLILIHGRDDDMVPYTESMALAEAAPQARLYLLDGLAHVDLDDVRWRDALRLWKAIDALLAERSRAPRAAPGAESTAGPDPLHAVPPRLPLP